MTEIFVNLKRFDVPRQVGGLAPVNNPLEWITSVMAESVEQGLGTLAGIHLTYLLPEGLVPTACQVLSNYAGESVGRISIGCQGVHWADIEPGKNFGAFTTSRPAKAAAALGCTWAIIGHSEERRDKLQVIEAYDAAIQTNPDCYQRAQAGVSHLIQKEVVLALRAGLNVLLCVGETAEERGQGDFEAQKPRIRSILDKQLSVALDIPPDDLRRGRIVIGYEPIWAIGPGKIPPDASYIAFVSDHIKQTVLRNNGLDPIVVYGGGLKEENAAMIAGIPTIGGGLVALTRFTGEIGFHVSELKRIIEKYLA